MFRDIVQLNCRTSEQLLLLLVFLGLGSTRSFQLSLAPTKTEQCHVTCHSSFDYEYLPPNPDASPDESTSKLSSSFPDGTPAGLRGEAVRSALKSGQCIGWEFSSDKYLSSGGVLQVQGKGMRDFLSNKLTQDFTKESGDFSYREACLLDGKGRVIDRIKVAIVDDETALILTSPGHSSQDLLDRLDPFVFPMDQITLTNLDDVWIFSLASVQWKDIEMAMKSDQVQVPKSFSFPSRTDQSAVFDWDSDGTKVLIIPSVGMPSQACVGFTFCFYGNGANARPSGQSTWKALIGESNPEGPIAIGALEYETLRIQAGVPAFGLEIGPGMKTSPLELHWQETINMDKGCYLGQEGVASIVRNPRGPPRTFYAVVFDDVFNTYETQTRGDGSDFENLTRPPRVGDTLFALGSNEKLRVGTLTSVAEPNGTGELSIIALALVRRADSILKQMKELDIEIDRDIEDYVEVEDSSGMIQPPPLETLDGLEVMVGGSFTVGKLRMIPSRGTQQGRNIFDERISVEDYFEENASVAHSDATAAQNEDVIVEAQAPAEAEEAEAATAEAKRKEEKMAMLRKRAEEAMVRRKKEQN